MKLALLLLVACVAVSHQQQYWPQLLQNRAFFYDPSYFAYQSSEPHQLAPSKDSAQFRLFNKFNGLFTAGGNTKPLDSLRPITLKTATATEFVTNTFTATVAAVTNCVPSTMFITQLGIGGAVTSTSPCQRKRRATDGEIVAQPDDIAPSNVAFVEPSAAPAFDEFEEKPLRAADTYEISSSQRDLNSDPVNSFLNNYFPGRTLTITSTFTRTLSSYTFSTIVFKKTVSLAGLNALSCLPAGHIVC